MAEVGGKGRARWEKGCEPRSFVPWVRLFCIVFALDSLKIFINGKTQQVSSVFPFLFNSVANKESEQKVDAFSSDLQHMRGQKDSPNHPFRSNAMADKRHSSVTAKMPLFLILERQCSRLSTENDPSAHILRRRIICQCISLPNCFQEF